MILENNKDIKDKIFLFSKLLPSKKRQIENQDLVKKLYDSEGEYIKNEFGIENFKYFKKLEFIGEKEFKRIFGKNIFNKLVVHKFDFFGYTLDRLIGSFWHSNFTN